MTEKSVMPSPDPSPNPSSVSERQAFDIVAYDGAKHRGFVFPTFVESVGAVWPWSLVPYERLERELAGELMRGSTALVAVSADDHAVKWGWLVARPGLNVIIAGYTLRRLRRAGVATALAAAAGLDMAKPVGVWFWTYACERMLLEHGRKLYHRVTELK